MRYVLRGLVILLLLLVTACPRIPFLSQAPVRMSGPMAVAGVPALRGVAVFPVAKRQTQAALSEIGTAATVALIDTTTNYTLGTTVSSDNGQFILNFSNSFRPVANTVYYLEAVKGLQAGTNLPNRVGAAAARVRTLVSFQNNQWVSISGSGISINCTTTALSIILSLRSMTPTASGRQIPPASLIGVMQPQPETDTTPSPVAYPNAALLPGTMIVNTFLLVKQALLQDADPFSNIYLDTSDALYNTVLNAPKIISVAALSPNTQTVGGTLVIIGSGFSATASDDVVQFTNVAGGPIQATVTGVSADLARLTVNVPNGAVTGPVAVTVLGRKMIGPTFYLALQSGHEAIDSNGNLYVSNETFGTLARVSPQGLVSTFVTGLTSPRSLSLHNGLLYVACAGAEKGVVAVDPSNPASPPVAFGTQGAIVDPRGLAFDATGSCYVTDGANNRIYRIDAPASVPVTLTVTGVGLNNPHGIAFGADGRLYVANNGANNVLGLTMGASNTASSAIFQQGLSSPWGVAFDSLGNMYVSNKLGNSIYRWQQSTNTLAPYADMPSPGGLVADRAGYVYAIDNTSNNVYRITSLGDSALYASGISSPTGVSKVGNTLYVLSQTNNSLVAIDTTTSNLQTVARGFNQPMGLAYDSVRDCFYVSNTGNGTITQVGRTTGTVATVLTGLSGWGSGPGGIMYQNGRLYVPSGQNVLAYDVTNFAAAPSSYASNINNLHGVSKDTVSVAASGSFYIATGTNNRLLRVVGDAANTGYSSGNGGNYVVLFKDSSTDSNLNNPYDVTVDSSGNVWCANYGSNTVTSYTPAGAQWLPAIASGAQPSGINFDGTNVWVVNSGAPNITGYNPATGAQVGATITCGSDHPRNLCFKGGVMYVVCAEGVGKVTGFGGATPSYTRLTPNGAGGNDIEVGPDGSIYVMNGNGYKISPSYSSVVQWYTNYNSPNYLWQVPGGSDFYFTDTYRFGNVNMGYYDWRMAGSNQSAHGYKMAGVDSNGNVYIQGSTQCGADTVTRIRPTAPQTEWCYTTWDSDCYNNAQGAYAADGNGNFYIATYQGMGVTKVDATGTPTSVVGNLSSSYGTYGLWVDPTGTTLYETCNTFHRVDQITVATGARTTLPYGLSSAEM